MLEQLYSVIHFLVIFFQNMERSFWILEYLFLGVMMDS